ncbi:MULTISPECIES: DUF6746 family protein [Halomonas]|uniref:Uncharacterized protein n=2 Tax=Halomonas TaxID=2745 RepID=A0A7X5ALK5_9GAMM|nr:MULTISPECIES: DUF6746 family protein [Halomonas]MDR5902637.1 hypothetical protein [Halomonas icarae]NAW12495.1 hypothetical protein [Halomonas icarae]TDB04632.1 hypothetical protein E0702_03660 [Halomonas marinisediminis]
MTRHLLPLLLAGLMATPALADDDQPQHFSGKPADTMAEAVANASEANRELAELLDGELSDADLARIHQLSYTMENALGRIHEEVYQLEGTLEEVHLGSEAFDRERVRSNGEAYLDGMAPLLD